MIHNVWAIALQNFGYQLRITNIAEPGHVQITSRGGLQLQIDFVQISLGVVQKDQMTGFQLNNGLGQRRADETARASQQYRFARNDLFAWFFSANRSLHPPGHCAGHANAHVSTHRRTKGSSGARPEVGCLREAGEKSRGGEATSRRQVAVENELPEVVCVMVSCQQCLPQNSLPIAMGNLGEQVR